MEEQPPPESNKMSKRKLLFVVASLPFAPAIADAAYIPAISTIGKDLQASDDMIALTLSLFLLAVGLGPFVWGPVADSWGRRKTALVVVVLFTIMSVACALAPTIGWLILLRSLQGAAGGGGITVASAVVNDTFAMEERSGAMGTLLAVMLAGPVIGPFLGGMILGGSGEWRYIFVMLAVAGLLVGILCLFWLPETLAVDDETDELDVVVEGEEKHEPSTHKMENHFLQNCKMVFSSLILLWTVPEVALASVVAFFTFAGLFAAYIVCAKVLEVDHALQPSVVGNLLLITGAWCAAINVLGGRLADWGHGKWGIGGRLVPGVVAMIVGGLFLMTYGWMIGVSPAVAVIWFCLSVIPVSLVYPGLTVFSMMAAGITRAGSASACFTMLQHLGGAIAVQLTPPAQRSMGREVWFVVLGICDILIALPVLRMIWKRKQ